MLYDGIIVIGMLMLAGVLALPVTGGEYQAFRDVGYTLFLFAVWFAYLGLCWTLAGQTLGMRAWRIRITSPGGQAINWRTSLLRFAVSLLGALLLGAGYWMALLNPERLCWHDRASGTRLVRVSD